MTTVTHDVIKTIVSAAIALALTAALAGSINHSVDDHPYRASLQGVGARAIA
jgi:hypothetical protein